MKNARALLAVVVSLAGAVPLHSAAPAIFIRQAPEKTPVKGATVIPFAPDTNALTWAGAPTVRLNDTDGTFGADIWFAATAGDLRAHVVVRDPKHANNSQAWMVWSGDALMLAVNPRAPTVWQGQDDDGALIAAYGLTAKGTDAWAGGHGRAVANGARKNHIRSITRDEAKGLTTYEIAIPWQDVHTAPGYATVFGLAATVRDLDRGRMLEWGHSAFNVLSGGVLKPAVLECPTAPLYGLTVVRDQFRGPGDTAVFALSWAGQAPAQCAVEFMGEKRVAAVRSAGARQFSRATVSIAPATDIGESQPVRILLLSTKGDVVYSVTAAVERPSAIVTKLLAVLDTCIERATHPVLKQSYRDSKANVQTVWLAAQADTGSAFYSQTLDKCRALYTSLLGIGTPKWQEHATGIRPLMRLFRSGYDNSLQPYHYRLPYPYDSTKAYPLVVSLHAYSDHHPLVVTVSADPTRDTANLGNKGRIYEVNPWARGNLYYEEAGAADVLAAVDDFCRSHRVDRDRIYLAGNSMGGHGTWAVGARTPDRWAALCPRVCWNRNSDVLDERLMRNVKGLPVLGFAGEHDDSDVALLFEAKMKALGNSVEMQVGKGMGHEVPTEFEEYSLAWMLRQKRVKPTSATFLADNPRLNKCHGIRLFGTAGQDPEYAFTIKGSVLTIDTKHASELNIWLGDDGLGMGGTVTVVLNGKEAYRGEPKQVDLGVEQQPAAE